MVQVNVGAFYLRSQVNVVNVVPITRSCEARLIGPARVGSDTQIKGPEIRRLHQPILGG